MTASTIREGCALNVAFWHETEVQRPLELGLLSAPYRTFVPECRFIAGNQT
ncbi:MAG: hypothetical protein O7I42_03800 [Alphaproteobacteria bacterium]|nr:hypothetical protein [Alphaproteobacteria bacterium]